MKINLDTDEASNNNNADALLPAVPKDFELFLNLVEFCKLILPTVHQEFFEAWIYIFGRELIVKSNQYPLVSGFYKLLSVTLKIAEKRNYFKGMRNESRVLVNDAMDVDSEEREEDHSQKQACFNLFWKFTREVLVRMRQYKEELLASCLELVLSVPKEFIEVPVFVPSMQSAFKLGLSYPLSAVFFLLTLLLA